MFEKLIGTIAQTFIGRYLKNFDSNLLQIELLKGKVELANLATQEITVEMMEYFITMREGVIGYLRMDVPWNNLSLPIVCVVKDVLLKVLIKEPGQEDRSLMRMQRLQSDLELYEKDIEITKREIQLEQQRYNELQEKKRQGINIEKQSPSLITRLESTVAQTVVNHFQASVQNVRVEVDIELLNMDPIHLSLNLDQVNIL